MGLEGGKKRLGYQPQQEEILQRCWLMPTRTHYPTGFRTGNTAVSVSNGQVVGDDHFQVVSEADSLPSRGIQMRLWE